jgi:hypothetical protein
MRGGNAIDRQRRSCTGCRDGQIGVAGVDHLGKGAGNPNGQTVTGTAHIRGTFYEPSAANPRSTETDPGMAATPCRSQPNATSLG